MHEEHFSCICYLHARVDIAIRSYIQSRYIYAGHAVHAYRLILIIHSHIATYYNNIIDHIATLI